MVTPEPVNRVLAVSVEARAAYELLMSLSAAAERANASSFEIGPAWFERTEERAGADLLARVDRLTAGCGWVFGNILGLAIDTPEPRDGPAFIRHLAGLASRDVHLTLVGYTLRPFRRATEPAIISAAVDGDPGARRAFLRSSFPDHPTWPGALRGLLRMTSGEAAALLREVVSSWHERVFDAEAPALMALAERDAAQKRAALATAGGPRVIDLATRGWDYVAEPGVSQVILAPSVVQRPWNVTADHGHTRIFCYSVADETLASVTGDPPAFLVRRLKALADERRLRILRRLVGERLSLMELAEDFGVSKTTIHHHLAILRSAGLIHLRDEPGRQYSPFPRYAYRAEAIPTAVAALEAYLDPEDDR